MPSGQLAFMKKAIAGGLQDLMPPSQEEVKDWKSLYLGYLNSQFSVKQGRALPLKYCVKNPRPDEVMEAFRSLQIRAIFEGVSFLESQSFAQMFNDSFCSCLGQAKTKRCLASRSLQVPAFRQLRQPRQ